MAQANNDNSTDPLAVAIVGLSRLNEHSARIARALDALMGTTSENLRPAMEGLIEDLIEYLNDTDGDPELEDGDADDPTRIEGQNCASAVGNMYLTPDDSEETGDHEPSLGSLTSYSENAPQTRWAQGGTDDREEEHDGREEDDPDEDGGDHEPSLGSFDRMANQTKSWHPRDWNGSDLELDNADHELSDTGIGDNDGLLEQTGGAH